MMDNQREKIPPLRYPVRGHGVYESFPGDEVVIPHLGRLVSRCIEVSEMLEPIRDAEDPPLVDATAMAPESIEGCYYLSDGERASSPGGSPRLVIWNKDILEVYFEECSPEGCEKGAVRVDEPLLRIFPDGKVEVLGRDAEKGGE